MENRRYIPATKVPPEGKKEPLDSTDITGMLSRTVEILSREITNLNQESCTRKLSKDSATALVSYIKLLNELQTKEKELAEESTDEELESIANETQPNSRDKGTKEEN